MTAGLAQLLVARLQRGERVPSPAARAGSQRPIGVGRRPALPHREPASAGLHRGQRFGPHGEGVVAGRDRDHADALRTIELGGVVDLVDRGAVGTGHRDDRVDAELLDGDLDVVARLQRQGDAERGVGRERPLDRSAGPQQVGPRRLGRRGDRLGRQQGERRTRGPGDGQHQPRDVWHAPQDRTGRGTGAQPEDAHEVTTRAGLGAERPGDIGV